jgi:hypothetical protein
MTQHRKLFRLPDDPSIASTFCHPDDPSIARGWKDLGQLRASEAGSGFEIAQRSTHQRAAHQTDAAPRFVGRTHRASARPGFFAAAALE